jgi:hypothetical protein
MAIEAVALAIIDRLIQLLTLRERDREKFFNNVIEPLYKDAEPVAKDYMALLAELAHRIKDEPMEEVIGWLEQRRTAYQPVRMKLRALLEDPVYQELQPTPDPTPLQRFTFGIWRLMTGGARLTGREGYIRMPEYGYHGHTILELIHRIRLVWENNQLSEKQKENLLRKVQKQQLAIEGAWADVVKGYAELRRQNL